MIDNINDLQDGSSILGKLDDARPSGDWTLEQLGKYAKRHEETAKRKMAIHTYRQGHALTIAYARVEAEQGYGHWGAYLKQQGISTSSDDRARKLYALVDNEEALAGLHITEAYHALGIEKPKTPKAARTARTAKAQPACRKSERKSDVDNGQQGHRGDQSPELDVPAESDTCLDGDDDGDDGFDGDDDGHDDMLRTALKTVQKLSAGDPWKMLGQMIGLLGLEWSDVAAWAARQAVPAPTIAEVQVVDAKIIADVEQVADVETIAGTEIVAGTEIIADGEIIADAKQIEDTEIAVNPVVVSAQEHSASAMSEEQVAPAEIVASAEIVVIPAPALFLGGEADVSQAAIDHREEGLGDDMGHKPSQADPAKVTVGGRTYDVAWASGMWFFRAGNDWIACSKEFVQAIEVQMATESTTQAA